eukprot:gene7578-9025_t
MAQKVKGFTCLRYDSSVEALLGLYETKIKQLESDSLFDKFGSALLTSGELRAKPLVMLVGQYSTGKTTFIRYLLGKEFPGQHIGPEPTTDGFVALMEGPADTSTPGNTVTADPTKPFRALTEFGPAFLGKFQCGEVTDTKILDSINLSMLTSGGVRGPGGCGGGIWRIDRTVDTPGILAGEKQTLGRQYDFTKVCRWFAERADLIMLLFDCHKLDISDELKTVILTSLAGQDEKVRLVLNKADQVSTKELMKVYGAVMWSLGKVLSTPEVKRAYVSSFWDEQELQNPQMLDYMDSERQELVDELKNLPTVAEKAKEEGAGEAVQTIDKFVRRARMLKTHVLILSHLRGKLPMAGLVGRANAMTQKKILDHLDIEFQILAKKEGLDLSSFPKAESYKEVLLNGQYDDWSQFPKLTRTQMETLEAVLEVDIPHLLNYFAAEVSGAPDPFVPKGECEGWLMKAGGRNPAFKRRWCKLKNRKLEYFKKASDETMAGFILLQHAKVEVGLNLEEDFALLISGENLKRTFKICAENADDMVM